MQRHRLVLNKIYQSDSFVASRICFFGTICSKTIPKSFELFNQKGHMSILRCIHSLPISRHIAAICSLHLPAAVIIILRFEKRSKSLIYKAEKTKVLETLQMGKIATVLRISSSTHERQSHYAVGDSSQCRRHQTSDDQALRGFPACTLPRGNSILDFISSIFLVILYAERASQRYLAYHINDVKSLNLGNRLLRTALAYRTNFFGFLQSHNLYFAGTLEQGR